ncbi:MAG: L-seryl-tRNA(Sec) selenium transferase [Anaerolineae bacterium]|nr:L-seryl-tRNA(Sec) selenium transferase [Anaerolineae bacterium]MDW8099120.1 L-seryl-tRNA(Sec) selenium transferase [Anaerolineae bacterium]
MGRDRSDVHEELRKLPSVDRLLQTPALAQVIAEWGQELATSAARAAVERARQAILDGETCPELDELAQDALAEVHRVIRPSLRRLINATGVIIHTNLGRAPLSRATQEAMIAAARGYTNLEYDLAAGQRGSRYEHAVTLLRQLTGAEDALVVNNNAGAVLLALAGVAAGHEVIVSRGQLVEIGGGFRVPEVMQQSGARLVEVGTTNRTHLRDYQMAIRPETAALLRVHRSNFRIIGFTSEVSLAEMVALAREHGLAVVDDLGSGSLLDTTAYGLAPEPRVQESVAAGADLVTFSGDKLLGGPQAGVIVGRAHWIQALRRHPLARALRVDKLTLAGLQATLLHYLRGEAEREIPVWRMIATPPNELTARAQRWASLLAEMGIAASVAPAESAIGGGSLPGETLPTTAVVLSPRSAEALGRALREGDPPVVVRIAEDKVWLDPRTVFPEEEAELLAVVRAAWERVHG